MNISDLAALVTVRNHITTVMGDKTVSVKDDFKSLNEARVKLDKKFISTLKELNVDDLFSNKTQTCAPSSSQELIEIYEKKKIIEAEKFSIEPSYLNNKKFTDVTINLSDDTVNLSTTDGVWEEEVPSEEEVVENKEEDIKEDPEAAELALIAARVKAQKELLKKEGRSNKRISKAKEDDGSAK